MDIKFRITKYLAVSALAMLLLGACSKNNIYINYPDEENNGGSSGSGNDDNNGNPAKENALITFSASVEGRNITRAMSPMGKGLQSWLCAYTANTSNNITGAPIAQGNYVTSSPGVLTGNLGYKMYLSNAIYSFYAVSCNSNQPGAYFHQRTIRTFIQRSRLSLVARGSSGHRQFTGKYPHNLPTRSHASSCSDRWRRKYHFKQDTFRYHHSAETGRNHGLVNRYHHFGSQL